MDDYIAPFLLQVFENEAAVAVVRCEFAAK